MRYPRDFSVVVSFVSTFTNLNSILFNLPMTVKLAENKIP